MEDKWNVEEKEKVEDKVGVVEDKSGVVEDKAGVVEDVWKVDRKK